MSSSCLVAQIDSPLSSLETTQNLPLAYPLPSAQITAGTYYNLGCKHQGWAGYFLPQRWDKTVEFGDGGVDVTEAPNAEVAEGVTPDRLEVQTGASIRYAWRITIPADGYLYFQLEKVGSFLSPRISSTDTDIEVIHNHEQFPFNRLADGSYFSPLLEAGDIFGLVFSEQATTYNWSQLTFYSNSVGVLVSPNNSIPWAADTVTPIPKAAIDQLFFPNDKPETWPIVDLDGDLFTLEDQIIAQVGDPTNPLPLSYRDQIRVKEGQYWVSREFVVKEPCGGNSLKIRRWWHPLPLLPFTTDKYTP